MDKMNQCVCLEPVYAADARVLVLGSMPGRVSLKRAQYYAHARNAFWPIIYGYFGARPDVEYEKRLAFAIAHGIALWDSAAACRREGSLDARMREIEINDFTRLFRECPCLKAVACNGQSAYRLFMKSPWSSYLPVFPLPSTSPAYAAIGFKEKAERWAKALAWAQSTNTSF